jgi:hypothetical protein
MNGPRSRLFKYNKVVNELLECNKAAIPNTFGTVDTTRTIQMNTKEGMRAPPEQQHKLVYSRAFTYDDNPEVNLCHFIQAMYVVRQLRRRVSSDNTYVINNYKIEHVANNYDV